MKNVLETSTRTNLCHKFPILKYWGVHTMYKYTKHDPDSVQPNSKFSIRKLHNMQYLSNKCTCHCNSHLCVFYEVPLRNPMTIGKTSQTPFIHIDKISCEIIE